MQPLKALLRCMARIMIAWALLYLLVSATPLVEWWTRALADDWREPDAEVLVVLGGEYLTDRVIGLSSYWRSVYALRACRQHHFRRVILSGVGVAPLMREFLIAGGVPPRLLEVEDNSRNTRENALWAKRLLWTPLPRTALITSDYHMFRAQHVFLKAGIPVEPVPAPDALKQAAYWQTRWPVFLTLVGETAKIVYYRLKGWI